jgi:hypothetical protein
MLRMNQRPIIENPRNYPAVIVNQLPSLLTSSLNVSPDLKRKTCYDIENGHRIYFIYVSPVNGNVVLLASWLRAWLTSESDNFPEGFTSKAGGATSISAPVGNR